jgi:hypothetical protein
MERKTKSLTISNKSNLSPLEIINEIRSLLHIKLSTKELIEIRDIVLSKHKNSFGSKKGIKKIYIYHLNKSNINKGKIAYNHLLISELIYNFVIGTRDEYLKKCEEYKITPFSDVDSE